MRAAENLGGFTLPGQPRLSSLCRQIRPWRDLSPTHCRHFWERTEDRPRLEVGTGVLTPTASREARLTRPRLP